METRTREKLSFQRGNSFFLLAQFKQFTKERHASRLEKHEVSRLTSAAKRVRPRAEFLVFTNINVGWMPLGRIGNG